MTNGRRHRGRCPNEHRQGRTSSFEAKVVGPRRENEDRAAVVPRVDVALSAGWGAGSVVEVGAAGEARNDRCRCRNFHSRCHDGSRKQMDGAFLSIDGNALALGMLVDEDVVPQVKRVQRKACGEQTQDCDVGESRVHSSHWEALRVTDTTQHAIGGQVAGTTGPSPHFSPAAWCHDGTLYISARARIIAATGEKSGLGDGLVPSRRALWARIEDGCAFLWQRIEP